MRARVSPEAMPGKIHNSEFSTVHTDNPFEPIRPGSTLPFHFQRQMKSLREFVDGCRSALNDIQRDFAIYKLDPDNPYRQVLEKVFSKRDEKELNTIAYYRKKKEIDSKKIKKEKKEKLFRFVDEKKKEEDETYEIKIPD